MYNCRVGHNLLVLVAAPIELTTPRAAAPQVRRTLTRDIHPVLAPLCVTEDSRSGEGFRVRPDCGFPRLQLAVRTKGCLSRSVAKLADEQCIFASKAA